MKRKRTEIAEYLNGKRKRGSICEKDVTEQPDIRKFAKEFQNFSER